MRNQGSYDLRTHESYLCNCIYTRLQKVNTLTGFYHVTPRQQCNAPTNQASCQATDVGTLSFVGHKGPVRSECEVII